MPTSSTGQKSDIGSDFNVAASIRNARRAQENFVKIDLRAALLMMQVASNARNPELKRLHIRNAHRAYDVMAEFLKRMSASAGQMREVKKTLAQLEAELVNQGEIL